MDWMIIWTAASVIISLGSIIFMCFKSLSNDIRHIDQNLSKLEGAFEEIGRWEAFKAKGK